jgi:outer membrane receptor protein involved in Fe transport
MRIARPIQGAGKNAEVYASLNNLFDKTYVYNAGYTMPGRNFRVGLITHF